jgi:hypothetical protein
VDTKIPFIDEMADDRANVLLLPVRIGVVALNQEKSEWKSGTKNFPQQGKALEARFCSVDYVEIKKWIRTQQFDLQVESRATSRIVPPHLRMRLGSVNAMAV